MSVVTKRKRQQAFELSALHLMNQGFRCGTEAGGCHYRGCRDARCAIGAIIGAPYYTEAIESNSIDSEIVRQVVQLSGWPVDDESMAVYTALQGIHDEVTVRLWPKALHEMCAVHGLNWTPQLQAAADSFRHTG